MARAHASAVVVAAGAGTRLGADEPKSLLEIGGRTIVAVAVGAVVACPAIDDVVVAAPPGFEDRVLAQLSKLDPSITVVSGGETRQRSVAAALQAVSASDIVVIHDAARPFASPDLFTAVVQAVVSGADGAVPILPLTDTVKRVRGGLVVQTEAREELGLAQTPQACRAGVLRAALERAANAGLDFTDDAGLLEWMGATVRAVPGEPGNFKITTLLDLLRADELLRGGSG
jgi:2-C-methyl-D-erythritol 4-phosphate cytidylyltransferase